MMKLYGLLRAYSVCSKLTHTQTFINKYLCKLSKHTSAFNGFVEDSIYFGFKQKFVFILVDKIKSSL